MKFNERLKELREKSKLTQEQLAKISGVSSRMIQRYEYGTSRPRLDAAEKLAKALNVTTDQLLGNGDMLYMPIGTGEPVRVQGCFASNKDISATIEYIKSQVQGEFDDSIIAEVESFVPVSKGESRGSDDSADFAAGSDEDYVERAMEVAVNAGQLSTSMLQRKLKLGYARAARIMDELEEMGVIGPSEGAKPRHVLMSKMQYDERKLRRME